MTQWKHRDSENAKVPVSPLSDGVRRKATATYTHGQTRMGSNSTGCEDVSSSMSDCTSTSGLQSTLQGKTNGVFSCEKENEYNFELTGNEAESFVPVLRNGRASTTGGIVYGRRANSTVTTTSEVERPSNSGIPYPNREQFLKDPKSNRLALGSNNEVPSSSCSQESTKRRGFDTGSIPGGAGSGQMYGGNATYVNKYKPNTPVGAAFPNQLLNPWPGSNRSVGPEPDRPAGDVGLNNMGNTCFMNSGLQCLLHTPSLVEYFLKLNLDRLKAPSVPIVSEFQFFMQHAWFGLMNSIYITTFRTKVYEAHAQFKDGRQHDCQEFLTLMLDSLNDQLKIVQNPSPEGIYQGGIEGTDVEARASEKENESEPAAVHKRNGHFSSKQSSKRAKLEIDPEEAEAECSSMVEDEVDIEDVPDLMTDCEEEPVPAEPPPPLQPSSAEEYWEDYVQKNNTVITNTFQGLFKNTMVCGECSFVSSTYEPFMYLSLPIPQVMTPTTVVTFVSLKDRRPIKVTVPIHGGDTVERLKELVAKEIPGLSVDQTTLHDCVVAEVTNNHVSRRLDNHIRLNNFNQTRTNLYMYQLNDNFCEKYGRFTNHTTIPAESANTYTTNAQKSYTAVPHTYVEEDWDRKSPSPTKDIDTLVPNGIPDTTTSPIPSPQVAFIGPLLHSESNVDTTDTLGETVVAQVLLPEEDHDHLNEEEHHGEHNCTICLEDFGQNDIITGGILKHLPCGTIICEGCIPRAVAFYYKDFLHKEEPQGDEGKYLNCPGCLQPVNESSFQNFENEGTKVELNLVPVLLRLPLDYNNNSSKGSGRLFGAPMVVRIPSTVPAEELYTFVADLNPFPDLEMNLVKVSTDGDRCSVCFGNCDGCPVNTEGTVSIPPSSALALSYNHISREQISSVEPPDTTPPVTMFPTNGIHADQVVDLHDCLRTFSEVEHLDDPWPCPECKERRRATKTMTICRFPDYLIIHLKRFIFTQHSSKVNTKLRFPLTDLDMTPYLTPELESQSNNMFDLYSCVCHFGSTNAGHYTAYAKNPVTNTWSYFNDDSVLSLSEPGEKDYGTAYVLFFQRRGLKYEIPKRTEDTIIRNPPTSLTTYPPATTSGPLVVYNPMTNGTSEQPADSQEWESPSLLLSTPSSYATTLEPTVITEMNFSAGHSSINDFPHDTSRISEDLPGTTSADCSYLEDDGFGDDFLLDDPLNTENDYQQEPTSQSGYNGEDDDVCTSSISTSSHWHLD